MRYCPTCGARFSEEVSFCPTDGSPTAEMAEAASEEVDPLIDRVIDGRYRIEKQIGEGGMGVVYLAKHTVLGKKIALKVLRGEMARDEETVKRFMQEAQAATQIGQQNIIQISDFGQLPDKTTYFVMEYLDGMALSQMIRQGGSVPTSDAVRIVKQIAQALGAAHRVGVIHRDLKPDNVFLINQGGDPYFVKVLDFGIAKVGGAASKLTKTGMVFGTPHYMAPEQAAGQAVDQRTDIYALGVIMYEMFTGKVPFDADTFMAILSKHMFEPPIPPSERVADVKLGAVEDVIMKALAKKAEERYQSMDELVADLDAVASGGSVVIGGRGNVAPPGNLADALEPPSRTEMRISTADVPTRSVLPVMLGLFALLLLGGGGAAAAFLLFGGEEEVPGVVAGPPTVAIADTGLPAEEDTGPGLEVEPPADVPRVEVHSEPSGAAVLADGAQVGNTPFIVRRPEAGSPWELLVRLQGYAPQPVTVLDSSPDIVAVTLEQEVVENTPSRPTMRRSGMRRPAMDSTEGTPPQMMGGAMVPASEVVDPWAQ